ncbi:MAG: hypothetical protein WB795_19400, partial [Candidatus Acidiferrales bacterium]
MTEKATSAQSNTEAAILKGTPSVENVSSGVLVMVIGRKIRSNPSTKRDLRDTPNPRSGEAVVGNAAVAACSPDLGSSIR